MEQKCKLVHKKNVDAFLASVEYENLRGSPTLVEDILDLSADTIDPKKQFKSRKLRKGCFVLV